MTETRKLYRADKDRKLFGVAAGLGEYFDVDPTIVRLVFVILIFANGVGLLLYLLFALIMPKKAAD